MLEEGVWYDQYILLANSVSLCPASFCTPRPNLPVIPGISWLPAFAFQSSMMKRASFLGVTSRRSYMSSQNHSTSSSPVLVVGTETWITVMLNGLPWKWTKIVLSFLRSHPSTAFWTLLLTVRATPFLLRDSWHSSRHNVLGLVVQSCPTLCDPMVCSPPGSSVHGDSLGKNTGVGCHALLQGIFPIQELNPGLPHCRWILYYHLN